MTTLQTEDQIAQQLEVETLIDDCINRESKLSDWERKFIDSLARKVEDPYFIELSSGQYEKLVQIWEAVTNE